jgi:hypothetical protein
MTGETVYDPRSHVSHANHSHDRPRPARYAGPHPGRHQDRPRRQVRRAGSRPSYPGRPLDRQLADSALRGACSGAARALLDWLIEQLTHR